jgi:hypothetical protein
VAASDNPPHAASFHQYYSALPPLGHEWSDQTAIPVEQIRLCKILSTPSSSNQPLIVSHSLLIISHGLFMYLGMKEKNMPMP